MTTEQQGMFVKLINELKDLFPDTTTSVKIIITADSTRLVQTFRHPVQLKKSGYSIRNIKGDFIKQDERPPARPPA